MEHTRILSFRASQDFIDAIDEEAERLDVARQILLRAIVNNWMKQREMFEFVYKGDKTEIEV